MLQARRAGARWPPPAARAASGPAARGARGAPARRRRGAPRPARSGARSRACSGSGAWSRRNHSRDRKRALAQHATAGTSPARSRARRRSVLSEAWPPTVERPSASRCSSARRVKTSMWRASSATWIASSCRTSRKCGCTWREEARRARSARRSRSRSGRSCTCTSASSTSSGMRRAARPRGSPSSGSHCAAARLAVEPRRPRRPRRTSLSRARKSKLRPAGLDARAARGEAPARGRRARRRRPARRGPARRRARRRASGRPGAAPRATTPAAPAGAGSKPWPWRAAPGAQVHRELRRARRAPRARSPTVEPRERALDQQVRALGRGRGRRGRAARGHRRRSRGRIALEPGRRA